MKSIGEFTPTYLRGKIKETGDPNGVFRKLIEKYRS